MDKYKALEEIWENRQVVIGLDEMGNYYKFKRENDRLHYTRMNCDEWRNDLSMNEFLTEYGDFSLLSERVIKEEFLNIKFKAWESLQDLYALVEKYGHTQDVFEKHPIQSSIDEFDVLLQEIEKEIVIS